MTSNDNHQTACSRTRDNQTQSNSVITTQMRWISEKIAHVNNRAVGRESLQNRHKKQIMIYDVFKAHGTEHITLTVRRVSSVVFHDKLLYIGSEMQGQKREQPPTREHKPNINFCGHDAMLRTTGRRRQTRRRRRQRRDLKHGKKTTGNDCGCW